MLRKPLIPAFEHHLACARSVINSARLWRIDRKPPLEFRPSVQYAFSPMLVMGELEATRAIIKPGGEEFEPCFRTYG